MLLASGFVDGVATQIGIAILGIWLLLSWYGKHNSNLKDAAKKAVAKKGIDIIGKWLK
jgi:hypothetical protein